MYSIDTHIPVSGFNSEALDINDPGAVVGILKPISGPRTRAFLWDTSLSILPDHGYAAEARAINSEGMITGAVETKPGRLAAAGWDQAHNLILLPEPTDAIYSFTHGIDHQGHIVGGYWKPGPQQVPLFWPNATTAPIVAPINVQWAEALAINDETGTSACGTTDTAEAFLWNFPREVLTLGNGSAAAIRGQGNEMFGMADGVPTQWHGGLPAELLPLDGLTGSRGIANDANASNEIVGDVFMLGLPQQTKPFLRRSFRRDEIDPRTRGALVPQPLQLTQPETINLNVLIEQQSGWVLTNAAAINQSGRIAGTGILANSPRAYRLSPPNLGSSVIRFFTLGQVMMIVGQVGMDGGGFGVTFDGHIIPMPPPRPEPFSSTRLAELVRETIRELVNFAGTEEARQQVRPALEAVIEEATRLLKNF
jgi:hypothetical protein